MKMRIGNTLIELDNTAYAQKTHEKLVSIYFVGIEAPLRVSCDGDERWKTVSEGSADELLQEIATQKVKQ